MPTHNPTVLHGLIPAVVTIAAVTRVVKSPSLPAWGVAAAALVYLAPSNEFLVFTVPVCLGLWFWVPWPPLARRSLARSLGLAGTTGLALLLAQTTSGVLAGIFRTDPDLGRLQIAPNSANPGQLSSWGFDRSRPWLEWAEPGTRDVPILSVEFLVDGGLLFWLLPLALGWVIYRRGASGATPWALIAAANVAVVLAFRADVSAPNLNRVAHAGFTLAVPALAIAASEALPRGGLPRRLAVAGTAIAALVLSGSFLLSAIAWPRMVAQVPVTAGSLPPGARDFLLRQTVVQDRLLAVHGAPSTINLYDTLGPGVTLDVSASTGQFIPYGYHVLSYVEQYRQPYWRAQQELADGALRRLGIRYVLVAPAQLTAVQTAAIDGKLADGRFVEVYRDPAGTAVIYEAQL